MSAKRPILRLASLAGFSILAIATLCTNALAATATGKPSRAAEQGCSWEKFSDNGLRLDAWVQRCSFGARKIDFVASKNSLAQRYSDAKGPPDPLVDVLDLKPGENPEAGIRRLFAEHTTDRGLIAHCLLKPYSGEGKFPAGAKRYTFEPDAALAKQLKAKQDPNDIPDPPCGDWGDAPDGVQYWEAQPASGVAKVLFVRAGQDDPLFDEASLKLR